MKQNRFAIFLALLSVLFPVSASADFQLRDAIKEFGERRFVSTPNSLLKTGPVKVHPTLRTRAAYDDNILLESGDPHEDVVFDIVPGTVLELPIQEHQLAVGYEADFENFVKRTDQNDQNQNFFALMDLNFPDWYINVLEDFKETSSRSGTTFTDRIPRFDQSINPKMGYRWQRLTFEAGFRHFARDFRRDGDDPFDFQTSEWSGVVYYDLFARLKALIEYTVAQIDYDDNFSRNGTFQQARLGLEGEIRPDMTVKLRVGPQFRNYEVKDEPDFNSWIAQGEIEYKMRENIRFELEARREAVEATFADVNFYVQHGVRFLAEYTFRPKWITYSQIEMLRNNYAERAVVADFSGFRRDSHISSKTGLRYLFRDWMEFELAYEYMRRYSNIGLYQYTDHIVSLTSSLQL